MRFGVEPLRGSGSDSHLLPRVAPVVIHIKPLQGLARDIRERHQSLFGCEYHRMLNPLHPTLSAIRAGILLAGWRGRLPLLRSGAG